MILVEAAGRVAVPTCVAGSVLAGRLVTGILRADGGGGGGEIGLFAPELLLAADGGKGAGAFVSIRCRFNRGTSLAGPFLITCEEFSPDNQFEASFEPRLRFYRGNERNDWVEPKSSVFLTNRQTVRTQSLGRALKISIT